PAKDRKAQGFMIGPAFVCYACKRRPGTTGCWSDDQSPIRPIWHSMSHSDPVRANCATSPLSLGCAGRSRNVSNRPRGRPDLIIVKRAVGTVGIVTWRFRCSPSRSSPACARACLKQKLLPPPAKRTKGVYPQLPDRNRGFDRHHGARIAAAHYPCAEAPAHRPELPLGLVTLETSPPSQRQTRPLSKTSRKVGIQITATVVLGCRKEIAGQVEEYRSGEANAIDPVQDAAMTRQKGSEILDATVALGSAHDEAPGEAHQTYDERQQPGLQDGEWRDPVKAGAQQAGESDAARKALDGLVGADARRDRLPAGRP